MYNKEPYKRIVRIVTIFLFIFSFQHANATITTVIVSGDWSAPENWDNGVPGCFDTIVIPVGFTIDVNVMVDLTACPATFIWVQGELHFNTGKKMDLACGSTVFLGSGPPPGSVTAGGGGGSSNLIDICGTTVWTAGDGDLTGPLVLCDFCLLPIELLYFRTTINGNIIELDWKTASESDNDYFTIERSINGELWSEIMEIDGAGNSSQAILYHEEDRSPLFGISYYRLKQTDFNGNYTYSDPVAVSLDGSIDFGELNVFPNPVNSGDNATVFLPQGTTYPAELFITGMDGRIVYQSTYHLEDNMGIVITTDYRFERGTYIIHCDHNYAKLVVR